MTHGQALNAPDGVEGFIAGGGWEGGKVREDGGLGGDVEELADEGEGPGLWEGEGAVEVEDDSTWEWHGVIVGSLLRALS